MDKSMHYVGQEEVDNVEEMKRLSETVHEGLPRKSLTVHPRTTTKHHRNSPCSCGSGLKYKHCCIRAISREEYRKRLEKETKTIQS
jgi:uncharacterized protein YchJ